MKRLIAGMLSAVALIGLAQVAMGQSSSSAQTLPQKADIAITTGNTLASPVQQIAKRQPWEVGVLAQGGVGLTQSRDSFKFLMAGVHLGKVMTPVLGHGYFRGQFEYAGEFFPYWQSYTPKFQRANCAATPQPGYTFVALGLYCSPYFTTGGTYTGTSLTPIILRWNYTRGKRFMPWVQGAGGILWTNHKYPAFGSPTLGLSQDGPNTEASVFNFTPQGGVGFHYFLRPKRSVDFSANGIHISSASLGDKNPGVNASVQFSLGYTWWK
ncbi:MAG: acyloxyacyl hydrolase [Acidobacteriaceae bacterium]|nr:acyloxyacyl hydrolase [Acidobacteriaceae bacterium]